MQDGGAYLSSDMLMVRSESRAFFKVGHDDLDTAHSHRLDANAWDVGLFIGLDCLGTRVSAMTVLAIILMLMIQLCFCGLMFGFMSDNPVSNEVLDSLIQFRAVSAHDVTLADRFTRTSVATLMCNDNMRLVYARAQAALHEDIQNYWHGAGPILSFLVQLIWLMLAMREMTQTWRFASAVWQLSSDRTEIHTKRDYKLSLDEKIMVSFVVKHISRRRVKAVFALIVFPRVWITILLYICGYRFVSITASLVELVFNATALSFILDVGNLCYFIFVPRRAQCMLAKVQPMRLKLRRRVWPNLTRIAFCALIMTFTAVYTIEPFFWRLRTARAILCSGNTDFVYAPNAVTGIAHMAMSAPDSTVIVDSSIAVLQAANLHVEYKHGYEPSGQLASWLHKAKTTATPMYVMQSADDTRSVNPEANYNLVMFDSVRAIGLMSPTEASAVLVCADHATGLDYEHEVALLRGATGVEDLENCSDPRVETLCHKLVTNGLRSVCPLACSCLQQHFPHYFFSSSFFGCPTSCVSLSTAVTEHYTQVQCEDKEANELQPLMGLYLEGLVEYLQSDPRFAAHIRAVTKYFVGTGDLNITAEEGEYLLYHALTVDENWSETLNRWLILPEKPHPRNLTGCDYLTSWEVTAITSINLCMIDTHRSIRWVCPTSCGCYRGMEECPLTCPRAPNVLNVRDVIGLFNATENVTLNVTFDAAEDAVNSSRNVGHNLETVTNSSGNGGRVPVRP